MALPKYNLVGKAFGYLEVIKKDKPYRTLKGIPMAKWICKCRCGKVVSVRQTHLISGATSSCGCFSKERQKELHKKYNTHEIKDGYAIFYTDKNEPFYVDVDDVEKIKGYYWLIDAAGYVSSPFLKIRLHRFIMECPKDMYVDHISGDKSDNRKSNLRICTPQQNSFNKRHMTKNKTGIIGVHKNKKGKYIAQISCNGKTIHLGTFENLQDAKNKRIEAENKLFGDFSPNKNWLNAERCE